MSKTYPFEGEELTLTQLRARIPAYGEKAIKTAVKEGCSSTEEVMVFLSRRDNKISTRNRVLGRQGAKAYADRLTKAREQWPTDPASD